MISKFIPDIIGAALLSPLIFLNIKCGSFVYNESVRRQEERKKEFNLVLEKNKILVNHIMNNLNEKDPVIMDMLKNNLITKKGE